MSGLRTGLSWVGRVVAWAVILVAVAAIALGVLIPRIGGATPYTILTGSMTPRMPPGTLVVVRPTDPSQLRIGDVVTYQLESGRPTVVTHRIVAERNTLRGTLEFRTKGDANDSPDPAWVKPVQIKGRLWYFVPFLGRTNQVVTGDRRPFVEYAAVAGLAGYAALMFAGAARDRVRSRRGRRHAGVLR